MYRFLLLNFAVVVCFCFEQLATDYVYWPSMISTKTVEQGAATTVYVAVHPQLDDGARYYSDVAPAQPTPAAENKESAAELWDKMAVLIKDLRSKYQSCEE